MSLLPFLAGCAALGRIIRPRPNAAARPLSCLVRDLKMIGRLTWHMNVRNPRLRPYFWGALLDCVKHNPRAIEVVLWMMVFYLHLGNFADFVVGELDGQIETARQESFQRLAPSAIAAT